jgi:pyruvate, water dikinase
MNLIDRVKNLFSPPRPIPTPDSGQEDLFKARYQAFRRLLSANNGALDFMTELEEAALGHRHFGMHFVRSRATGATAKVYNIVENLLYLAPGKYLGLRDSLRSIQDQIQLELASRQTSAAGAGPGPGPDHGPGCGRRWRQNGQPGRTAQQPQGTRALGLRHHRRRPTWPSCGKTGSGTRSTVSCSDTPWPPISGPTHRPMLIPRTMTNARRDQPIALLEMCAKIRGMILAAEIPAELEEAILSAYDRLCEREGRQVHVALRSSALGEDSAGASFAGQHRSLLNLDRDSLLDGYKEVVASKYSAHAMTYRYMLGIRDDDVLMCVGCLSMVTSKTGGVMYTTNPSMPATTASRSLQPGAWPRAWSTAPPLPIGF